MIRTPGKRHAQGIKTSSPYPHLRLFSPDAHTPPGTRKTPTPTNSAQTRSARQNMSLGLSLKPTPSELDKEWLIEAFKHNQRTSPIFNMLCGQHCDGQSQRRDPARQEAVHLLHLVPEHGDLQEPAVLRYDTPWTCITWASPESEQRQRPDSPDVTHSKIQKLMQADIIEAEDFLRTILITHADMRFAYMSHRPDRFACYCQQMAATVQLMHFHALNSPV